MAEQPQTIVEPAPPNEKPLGARNQQNISSIFSASPIHAGTITDAERITFYQAKVLDGSVAGGFGLANFSTSYTSNGAPELDTVDTGGAGKPATPYVPNPNSPGPGSVNAADIADFEGEIPVGSPEFGSGLGGTLSPSIASESIEKQTLGNYISGQSYEGSKG